MREAFTGRMPLIILMLVFTVLLSFAAPPLAFVPLIAAPAVEQFVSDAPAALVKALPDTWQRINDGWHYIADIVQPPASPEVSSAV
jgi:hypothetical protein